MLNIIYQDTDLLIVNKPSGLLSVPGLSSPDNLLDRALKPFPNARMVHRLDMSTSGLIIFALNYETQKALNKKFQNREIQKTYTAELYGLVTQEQGEISCPLICDWPNRPRQKIDWLSGKASHTFLTVLSRNKETFSTRVQLKPITGRSHQLRVHTLGIGHPILGDQLYSIEGSEQKAHRLLLHAHTLAFLHPTSKKEVFVNCDPEF